MPPLEQAAPPRQRRGGYDEDDRRPRRRMDEEIEYEEPGPRGGRRYPGEETSSRMRRPDMEDTAVGSGDKDDPADVACDGFEALMDGRERVVSASLGTKVQGRASRLVPDGVKAAMHRRMAEPGSS